MQSLPLYTSCFVSIFLNNDILGTEKSYWICLLNFDLDEFSGLFLYPPIFSIKYPRYAYIIKGALSHI